MRTDSMNQLHRSNMATPHQLAEENVKYTAAYELASSQLEEILARRPAMWQTLRESVGSDKAADRAYEATQDGIDEMRLRMKMKRWEKHISSNKTLIRIFEGEARNQI